MNNSKESTPTFFLVKNRALGDSVMGLSALSYLRSLYPKSTIIYAIPQWTTDLYVNVKTDADIIYPLKLDSLNDCLDLFTDLINLKVDYIHEMHQSGRGEKIFGIFSLLTGKAYTFHNHHLTSKTKVIDQGEKKELIQRDLDGIYSFYGRSDQSPHFLNFEPKFNFLNQLKINEKKIIFGVVATRETKMWPLAYFIKLATLIWEVDSKIKILVPLSTSDQDEEIGKNLTRLCGDDRLIITKKALKDLPKLFRGSMAYVGNDTGLKHIAVASHIFTITIFGPEPIREWHPYDRRKHLFCYIDHLSCRVRNAHYCGLSQCDLQDERYMNCMNKISPEVVMTQLFNMIAKEFFND